MKVHSPTRIEGYSSSDPKQYRYWSPTQQFASSDQLARCLQEGWHLNGLVEVEKYWFGDARFIHVYRVRLQQGNKTVTMAVMGNPYSRELLSDQQVQSAEQSARPNIRFEVTSKR